LILGASIGAQAQLSYKNFPSKVPERRTEYYAWSKARGGVKLVIEAKFDTTFTCYPVQDYEHYRPCEDVWSRQYVGTLTQKDGKLIAFLPDNPADKIIDRDLIGWVIFVSRQAIAEDQQYIKTANEYTDETGQRWIKKL